MRHPTPSDFVIDVTEAHVNVTFKPNGRLYCFGRLADPEDIVRFGPLSHSHESNGETDANGEYLEEEVARMAHTLAVKAVTTTYLTTGVDLQYVVALPRERRIAKKPTMPDAGEMALARLNRTNRASIDGGTVSICPASNPRHACFVGGAAHSQGGARGKRGRLPHGEPGWTGRHPTTS
jgi:hypothetical protein